MVDEFIISVETMNYETLESFPNANLFYEEYKEWADSDYRYVFNDSKNVEVAKTRLQSLKLNYQTYFKRRLSADELKNYPAVFLVVGSESDLYKDGLFNEKKFQNSLIQKDLETDIFIIHQSLIEFLKSKSVRIEVKNIDSTNGEYYWVQNFRQLMNSEEYIGCTGVKKVDNGKYIPINSDDRISINKPALKEVSEYKLLLTDHFVFNGERYPSTSSALITSGNFAYDLNAFLSTVNANDISIFVPLIDIK